MTSLTQINVTSLLVIWMLMVVRADHFEEFNIENEVGTFTHGYFTNREKTIKSLNQLNGSIVFQDDLLILFCNPVAPFESVFPPFKKTVYPNKLAIHHCILPNSSFAQSLQNLNINIPTIELLQHTSTHIDPLPKGNYMEGLNLKTLYIDSLYSGNIFDNNPDFLKPLTNLTTLIVWGAQVPELPENIHLESLAISHDTMVPIWDNCKSLKTLSIHNVNPRFISRFWPEECRNLTKIRMKGLTNAASHIVMAGEIGKSSTNLEVLYMQRCNLSNPPYEILKSAKNLKHLNFTQNRITDETLIGIPLLSNLTNLDLSRNFLTGTKLLDMLKQTPNLEYLKLDGNAFEKEFCNQAKIQQFVSRSTSLERLSLGNVPIGLTCFENMHFSKLKYLNLAFTKTALQSMQIIINLRKLPLTDANRLEVDLRGRQVKQIEFNSDDYLAVLDEDYHHLWGSRNIHDRYHRSQLTVLLNTLEYDCQNYWFCLVLLEFPDLITCPDCKCPRSKNDFKEEFQKLNCTVEYQSCFIKSDEETDGISLQCNDVVESVDLKGLSHFSTINLKDSRIVTVRNVPDSLKRFDIRSNNMSNADTRSLATFFENSKTNILLSKSFMCDCKLLEEVRKFKSQIENYDNITCIDEINPDQELSPENFCQKTTYEQKNYKSTFIAAGCIIIVINITFLVWWYKDVIKRFFVGKGWCTCCFKSEMNDAMPSETVKPNTQTI